MTFFCHLSLSFFFYLFLDGLNLTFFPPLSLSPQVLGLNFSSVTTPELLLKTFDRYCEYKRTPNGVVMPPAQLGKWMHLLCDEINLPDVDKYSEGEGEKEGRDKMG